jgi:hypothetical protein
MTPKHARLPKNQLFQGSDLRPSPEREALMKAKARQDETAAKFDDWIRTAIAELGGVQRATY